MLFKLISFHWIALVGIDKRSCGAVDYSYALLGCKVAQHLVTTKQLGSLCQILRHSVGAGWVGGVVVDGFGLGCGGVVVVAGDAAQTILVIYGEPIEQRVIHAVKLYCAVANLYGCKYSVLHHRTPIARAKTVTIAPELHASQTVKNG